MTHDSAGIVTRQLRAAAWRKSTFSSGGECVSVAETGDLVGLRNSNRPDGSILVFTKHQVAAWVKGCKASEYDDLAL